MSLVKRLEGAGKCSAYLGATSLLVLSEPILKTVYGGAAGAVKVIDPDLYVLHDFQRLPEGLRVTFERSYKTANRGFWLNLDRAQFGVEPE